MNTVLTAPARRMPSPQADALFPETCTCTPAVRYACGHCYHDQCLDCGFCTMGSCVCHCEYGLGFHPGDSPAEGPMFWLGGHHAVSVHVIPHRRHLQLHVIPQLVAAGDGPPDC